MNIEDVTRLMVDLDVHVEQWASITSWSESSMWLLVFAVAGAVVSFAAFVLYSFFAGAFKMALAMSLRAHCHECAVEQREKDARGLGDHEAVGWPGVGRHDEYP